MLAGHAERRARERAADANADPRPESSEGKSLPISRGSPGSPAARPPEEGAADAPPPAAGAVCLRSGGIEDRVVLAGVEEWLESHGAEVFEVRRERQRKVASHLVHLPPLADRETATARVRELRARGVRDVEVIERGPLANGLSFGLYEVSDNMRRRVEELRDLGYRVHIRDNWRVVYRYFIEARARRNPDGILAAWKERYPEWALDLVACI